MYAYIRGVGHYVPAHRMSNNDFTELVDTSDEWIFSHTGIRNRHIASEDEKASDLGVRAAEDALERGGCAREEIDCIITATTTPDYPSFPSTACLIEKKLGINGVPALDISVACSGFVYALHVAQAMLLHNGGYRNVLVIGSEVFSRILDWSDRKTCVLFGDGAGAVVLSKHDNENHRMIDSVLYTNCDESLALTREPKEIDSERGMTQAAEYANTECHLLQMDGKKVYLFAVRALQETIEKILAKNNLSIDDIDWIIPHQANIRIIEAACNRNHYDIKKFYTNIDEYANTSAASIPIALGEMDSKGLLKRGQKIICVGFGAGLSYGANLLIW